MEALFDSTIPTGMQMGLIGTWQEEVYQKIKSMKEMYYSKLYRLYQKIAHELQQNSLHQRPTNEKIEKLKMCKITLERIMLFLQLNKHYIQLAHKEKLLSVEKHINFLVPISHPATKAYFFSSAGAASSVFHAASATTIT